MIRNALVVCWFWMLLGLLGVVAVPAGAVVTVTGTVEFWDSIKNVYRPAKDVHVEVEGNWWDLDPDVQTDANGHYQAHQRDPYWGDFDGVDIEVYAETPGVLQIFEACYSWYPYHAISAPVNDVDSGETVTINVKIGGPNNNIEAYYRTPEETANAFVVHQEMLDHHQCLRAMGWPASDFGETEVIVPAAFGEMYYNHITGFINLGTGGFFGADDWANLSPGGDGWIPHNNFLVTCRHEYSHAIHDEITGFLPPLGFYPSRHSPAEESSSRWLAYTEGFAEFLPCATLNMGGRFEPTPWPSTTGVAGDWITQLPTENPFADHYSWEGEVAAVMWDLFDPAGGQEQIRRPAAGTPDGYSVPPQAVAAQKWVDRVADPNLARIRQTVTCLTGVLSGPVDTIEEFLGYYNFAFPADRHGLRTIAFNRCINVGLPPEFPPAIVGTPTISRDMGTLAISAVIQEYNPEDRPFVRTQLWRQAGTAAPVLLQDVTHSAGWNGSTNAVTLIANNVPFGTGPEDAIWLIVSDEMLPTCRRFTNPPSVVKMKPLPEEQPILTISRELLGALWMPKVVEADLANMPEAPGRPIPVVRLAEGYLTLETADGSPKPVGTLEDQIRAKEFRGLIAQSRRELREDAEREELIVRCERLLYGIARDKSSLQGPSLDQLPDRRTRQPIPQMRDWVEAVAAGKDPGPSLDKPGREALKAISATLEAEAIAQAAAVQRADDLMQKLHTGIQNEFPGLGEGRRGLRRIVADIDGGLQQLAADGEQVHVLQTMDEAVKVLSGKSPDGAPTTTPPKTPTTPQTTTPTTTPTTENAGKISEAFDEGAAQRWLMVGNAQMVTEGDNTFLTTSALAFGVWQTAPLSNLSIWLRYRHGQGTGDIALCTEPSMPPKHLYHLMLVDAGIGVLREQNQQPVEIGRAYYELVPGKWYDLGVYLQGGKIVVEIGGQQVLSAFDPAPLPAGFIGLGSLDGDGFAYDDITLKW